MDPLIRGLSCPARVLLATLVGASLCVTTNAEIQVIGVQYQPDRGFPEYDCLWHSTPYPGPCGDLVPGANVKVFVKNTGLTPETINDATLAGYSLKTVIQINPAQGGAASIYFYWSTPPSGHFECRRASVVQG